MQEHLAIQTTEPLSPEQRGLRGSGCPTRKCVASSCQCRDGDFSKRLASGSSTSHPHVWIWQRAESPSSSVKSLSFRGFPKKSLHSQLTYPVGKCKTVLQAAAAGIDDGIFLLPLQSNMIHSNVSQFRPNPAMIWRYPGTAGSVKASKQRQRQAGMQATWELRATRSHLPGAKEQCHNGAEFLQSSCVRNIPGCFELWPDGHVPCPDRHWWADISQVLRTEKGA